MILDQYGNELLTAAAQIAPGQEKLFTLQIECAPGYKITAQPPAHVAIYARTSPGDAWQDIAAGALDLSAFAPAVIIVYFRLTADGGAVIGDYVLPVIVSL